MNIFVIGFSAKQHCSIVEGLTDRGVTVSFWLSKRTPTISSSYVECYKDTTFFSVRDFVQGNQIPGYPLKDLSYPDEDLWNFILSYEGAAMQMMERMNYARECVGFLRSRYHWYISYWYGLLSTKKPNAVIFPDIPHAGYTFSLYLVAQYLGIKTVMMKRTKGIADRVLFFDNFTQYAVLQQRYQFFLTDKNLTIDNLSPEFQEHYLQFLNKGVKKQEVLKYSKELYTYIPERIQKNALIPSLKKIRIHVKSHTLLKTVYGYFRELFAKKNVLSISPFSASGWKLKLSSKASLRTLSQLRIEYEKLQMSTIDYTAPFVYFPLHLQPECSTNPQGGLFDDQLLTLSLLSSALPNGWFIYIKENPLQWHFPQGILRRHPGYYEQMAAIPHVKFVPADVSTYTLLSSARAVGTVTGTVGWEAIMNHVPILLFGYTWYMDCPGVLRVHDVMSCKDALHVVEQKKYTTDNFSTLAFFKALDDITAKAYVNKKFSKISSLSEEHSVQNMVQALYTCLTYK